MPPDEHTVTQAPAGRADPLRTGALMPEAIDRYKLVRLLGEGAFGRVYLALDPRLNRDVAIKVPRTAHLTDLFLLRFRREGLAAAKVRHPNVCQVLDADETADGRPYFVFEYVDGPNLAEHVACLTRLGPRDAARIMAGVARGVAAAHQAGIVHRDLKPANVLMDRQTLAPVVTDFGVARLIDRDGPTLDGQTVGTPAYMPREQWFGQLDQIGPRSDVYALGVMLFELVTGMAPYANAGDAVGGAPVPAASGVLPAVPAGVCAVARRAMQKDPADRYPTAGEFADALEGWLRSQPDSVPPPTPLDQPPVTEPQVVGGASTDDGVRFAPTDVTGRPSRRPFRYLSEVLIGGAVGLLIAACIIHATGLMTARPAASQEKSAQP